MAWKPGFPSANGGKKGHPRLGKEKKGRSWLILTARAREGGTSDLNENKKRGDNRGPGRGIGGPSFRLGLGGTEQLLS